MRGVVDRSGGERWWVSGEIHSNECESLLFRACLLLGLDRVVHVVVGRQQQQDRNAWEVHLGTGLVKI